MVDNLTKRPNVVPPLSATRTKKPSVKTGYDGSKRSSIDAFWRSLLEDMTNYDFHAAAVAIRDAVIDNREFAVALGAVFARAQVVLPTPDAHPAAPALPLPEKAPRLWADRAPGIKATQFLRETYAPWIEAGVLTRGALKACDKSLYQAYHVRVHRYPEEAITFKDAPPSTFIADPQEAIERRRASGRTASTKFRAKSDNLSHHLK